MYILEGEHLTVIKYISGLYKMLLLAIDINTCIHGMMPPSDMYAVSLYSLVKGRSCAVSGTLP